jgi:hypothetical protein
MSCSPIAHDQPTQHISITVTASCDIDLFYTCILLACSTLPHYLGIRKGLTRFDSSVTVHYTHGAT